MSVVPSQSYAAVGVPLFHPTSTALPPGPTGPAGPAGPTGPAGSGGGGFTPAGGQYNWTNAFQPSLITTTSLMASRNPQTTQAIGGMAYSSSTGTFAATGTNVGTYFVSVSFTWTCDNPYQQVPFSLLYGTTVPGNVIATSFVTQQPLQYDGTYENGDPALFPAFGIQTQTTLNAIVPLTTTSTRIGLFANTDGNPFTVYRMTWTLHRIA